MPNMPNRPLSFSVSVEGFIPESRRLGLKFSTLGVKKAPPAVLYLLFFEPIIGETIEIFTLSISTRPFRMLV